MRLLLAIGLIIPTLSFSQLNRKDVISSAGDYMSGSTHNVGYTVGEIAIEMFSGTGNYDVAQGYWYGCHIPYSMYCTISIEEIDFSNAVSMYPNPTRDMVTIEFQNQASEIQYQVVIRDMLGQIVLQSNYNAGTAVTLDLLDFSSGTYVISILVDDKEIQNEKIQKL